MSSVNNVGSGLFGGILGTALPIERNSRSARKRVQRRICVVATVDGGDTIEAVVGRSSILAGTAGFLHWAG